ncbi:MAG: DUF302 domain-containing protein [Steroidobacteraceae bacterium]
MGISRDIPGFVSLRAAHSVAETLERLEASLAQRGIAVFARIDFSADAARVGLQMRPEQLLIFGNPRAGTPLMQQLPEVGLDLPLKALAWEDEQGQTWLAYNDLQYIAQRYRMDGSSTERLAGVLPLLEAAAGTG